jgi:hypothetical protein
MHPLNGAFVYLTQTLYVKKLTCQIALLQKRILHVILHYIIKEVTLVTVGSTITY